MGTGCKRDGGMEGGGWWMGSGGSIAHCAAFDDVCIAQVYSLGVVRIARVYCAGTTATSCSTLKATSSTSTSDSFSRTRPARTSASRRPPSN